MGTQIRSLNVIGCFFEFNCVLAAFLRIMLLRLVMSWIALLLMIIMYYVIVYTKDKTYRLGKYEITKFLLGIYETFLLF